MGCWKWFPILESLLFNNMVDSLVKNNEVTEELANVIGLPDNLDA